MKIIEPASDLFLYLVTFRRRVRESQAPDPSGRSPVLDEVVRDLQMLFDRMDKTVRENQELQEKYVLPQQNGIVQPKPNLAPIDSAPRKKIDLREILAIVADDLVTQSTWEPSNDYLRHHLLERKYYLKNTGGKRFFQELSLLDSEDDESKEIFFIALGLGFQGRLSGKPAELEKKRRELFLQLPDYVTGDREKLTQQAYDHIDTTDCSVPPVARIGRYAVTILGILVFILLVARLSYFNQRAETLHWAIEIEDAKKK